MAKKREERRICFDADNVCFVYFDVTKENLFFCFFPYFLFFFCEKLR